MARALRWRSWLALAAPLALGLSACGSAEVPVAKPDPGEAVAMRSVRDSSTALRGFARQYVQHAAFWPDLRSYHSQTGRRFSLDRDIAVGEADLDDDGVPERFLTIDNPLFCGATGCTTYVLKKDGTRWHILLQNNVRAEIRVLATTDGGYHRLCMARLVEAWDGTQYQPIPSTLAAKASAVATDTGADDLAAYMTCEDGDTGSHP